MSTLQILNCIHEWKGGYQRTTAVDFTEHRYKPAYLDILASLQEWKAYSIESGSNVLLKIQQELHTAAQ